MTGAEYPLRVRLHGGRNVHVARAGNGDYYVTPPACGYTINAVEAGNHWLPGDMPVTCPRCARAVNTQESNHG